ncbi:tetratricopeptide repeat protein [Tundrisphaera lichenicola]|uniref:tetratricopeptide repeat protein n=1 Tax=Tundrisphaera lichenicola TaxID=2029860 RepID=UPI003EB95772
MSQASTAARTRPGDPAEVPFALLVADLGLIAGFLALTFLLGIFPLKDTDFWWHLKAGDLIRQTGQVPTVDTFTFGAEGHPWVDLHWGFQVALSWGYQHLGGVLGLNLAKCLITCLAVLLLITSRRREWPVWPMLLAWLPAILVLGGRMYIRPETISLLYLSIVLAILFRWERRPWLAFGLPIVQLGWVNTQGLFLLEPILIGFALIDAATRRGAFDQGRKAWWGKVLSATGLTALACLFNPYGLVGTLYPIQLAGTMSNPIFKNTIGELKPLPTFIEEVGIDNLPLQLHLATMALGALSFLLPLLWSGWVRVADRDEVAAAAQRPEPKGNRKAAKGKKKADARPVENPAAWRLSIFRILLFGAFSTLSLAATRNSHQFAAVVGTVTAWNFGEWAGAIRARKLRRDPDAKVARSWPRLATFGAIALVFASVASGRFYQWTGEGRTIGLGEEPLWFPREAVKFAGKPGMPDRLVGFHNGHPALYEYYWAPEKKVYTDARLELMGSDLYQQYMDLQSRIGTNKPGWSEELDRMGRPAVMVDNLDPGNAGLAATLFNSPRYRCVWFDPIVCLFVHDSNRQIVEEYEVDFGARHFVREADSFQDGPATLAATARSLRFIAAQLKARPGGDGRSRPMMLLGLDYARKLRETDRRDLDGWKQAGLLEYLRDPLMVEQAIPRFRLPFDPAFDLTLARSSYQLSKALALDPSEGTCLYYLANLFEMRGMDEASLPLFERFAEQPNKNLGQQMEKARAAEKASQLRTRLGSPPSTKWANLSELEGLVGGLLNQGRAATAAEVIANAFRPEARPWEWADRLAVLRIHLGQPDLARDAWIKAPDAPTAIRAARVAATYLIEGDYASAGKSYREALTADPSSFEAHYGLAVLEQDDGHAEEALAEAKLAEKSAGNDVSRGAARQIINLVSRYVAEKAKQP